MQARLDIDLYGTGVGKDLNLSSDSDQVSLTVRDLQEVAEAVKPHQVDTQLIEVIPFETTLYLSPSHHLQPEALVRIRITHSRGLDQPAGPLETQTVNAIERQIQALGVRSSRGYRYFRKSGKSDEEIHLGKPRGSPHGPQSISQTDVLKMRGMREESGNCAAD